MPPLAGVPLLIHITDSPIPLPDILAEMIPGDIITHCYHGRAHGIMGQEKQLVLKEVVEAQRHGIGIIYQELDLFPNLTAGENIVIRNLHFREGSLNNARRIESFCRPFLDQVGLDCDSRTPAASLSIGKLQLLAIARALSMNARIILMDEPTSSLFDDSAERLFDVGAIDTREPERCISGLILRGIKKPCDCPAFGRECTPQSPLGATMVSAEGACAAYFQYGRRAEVA